MLIVENPNRAPADAVLCSPTADGRWRVYMPSDSDIPAFVHEIPARPATIVTAQEFRDRFTDAELDALLASTDKNVKLLVLKIQTADPFPMDKPAVQQGLGYLVMKGIITQARRDVIGAT